MKTHKERVESFLPKYTSGEWQIKELFSKWAIVIDNSPFAIATVENKYRAQEINKANAKLIASSPELLGALKFANEIIDRLCSDYSMIANKHANYTNGEAKIIEQAIKKATE